MPAVHAAAWHDGIARELVAALKFGARTALAEVAAEAIARALPSELRCLPLVPVPPAAGRLRRRGFDPAALIAARLAGRLGTTVEPCLVRLDSGRQLGRSRSQRLAKPPAIEVAALPAAAALLVDDVLTTGATLRCCAAALIDAGRGPAGAAVFARARGPTGVPPLGGGGEPA